MEEIAEIMKGARFKSGESLKTVAERTGLTDTLIMRIERDEIKEPSASAICALCHYYKLSLVTIYKKLGWISDTDLADYKSIFKGCEGLSEEDRQHIQSEINYLSKREAAK